MGGWMIGWIDRRQDVCLNNQWMAGWIDGRMDG
jgi:hypothetical protein